MATWQQVSGSLQVISVGSRTNVWGIDKDGAIFRYSGDDNKPWVHMPGRGVDIGAAADGTVWYVNPGDEIFRYDWDTTQWVQVAGLLTRISAGSRTNAWGINKGGEVYRYNNGTGAWVKQPAVKASAVGAGADGMVWRISADQPWRILQNGTWANVPGNLDAISVGSTTHVWGINRDGEMLRYTGYDADPWVPIEGRAQDIGAAPDGTVWHIAAETGEIHRYTGDQIGS